MYFKSATRTHKELSITLCGLFVDTKSPYIGASPDAIIYCKCCGMGVLEVKCPYTFKSSIPELLPHDCFLKRCGSNNNMSLQSNHAYYYQVQMQLFICCASYCDFVVWTPNSLHVERIKEDRALIVDIMEPMKHFFVYGLLPEIIGKWYTRKPIADSKGIVQDSLLDGNEVEDYTKLWCYCNEPSYSCVCKWLGFLDSESRQ